MDVKLPDGTIVTNVPEGTTKAQLMAKIVARQKPTDQERADVADGITLRPFGFDTGIEMPQGLAEFLAGAGKRLTEIGTLGTHEAAPSAERLLNESGYATTGEIGSDVLSMLVGGSALRGAGLVKAAPSLLETAAGGAAYGAATNSDRMDAALMGGIGGAAGHGISSALGKVVAPKVTDGAKQVIDKGGVATPGEILGGMTKKVEDKATSLPFMGDMITKAKQGSMKQWATGVVNDILKPIGKNVTKNGKATKHTLGEVQDIISKEYDKVLGSMNVKLDQTFANEVGRLRNLVAELPKKEVKEFDRILKRDLSYAFDNPNQLAKGRTFKEADSSLRKTYKKFLRSQDPYQQSLGEAIRELHKAMLDMGKRQNGALGEYLSKIDTSYAKLKVVEDAAAKVGTESGTFTPAQLLQSIKTNTPKSRFAVGEGFDQKAVEAAKEIFGDKYPDSGTAGRLMSNILGLGVGVSNPGVLGGLAAGATAYTNPAMRLTQGMLTKRPEAAQAVRGVLDDLAPYTGLFGGAYGISTQ